MRITTETLTDYLNDKCNEATKQKIEQWIDEDIKNRTYLDELKIYWDAKKEETIPFDSERGFRNLSNKILIQKKTKKSILVKQLLRYAAVAAILISLTVSGFVFNWNHQTEHIVVVNNGIPNKAFTLPDGSQIQLKHGSSFEYPSEFPETERLVKLKGEAFFNISKNKDKPFFIETKHTKTKVVGTSFRITEYHNQTQIAVKTGIVEFMDISNSENKSRLFKGDFAVFKKDQKALLVRSKASRETKFNIRLLKYQNKTLGEICNDLEEIFDCTIRYNNKEIPELKLTAIFEDQNLEQIIESICFSLNLKNEINRKFILLK
ncbi:MAG: FecR family protein [Marinifilaceae bacterium]